MSKPPFGRHSIGWDDVAHTNGPTHELRSPGVHARQVGPVQFRLLFNRAPRTVRRGTRQRRPGMRNGRCAVIANVVVLATADTSALVSMIVAIRPWMSCV